MRSRSSSHTFIDLTDDQDEETGTNIADSELHIADYLAVLRARVHDLESENSAIKLELGKMKADLQLAQGELKITREALGQAVVANRQKDLAQSVAVPSSSASTSLKRARSSSTVELESNSRVRKVKSKTLPMQTSTPSKSKRLSQHRDSVTKIKQEPMKDSPLSERKCQHLAEGTSSFTSKTNSASGDEMKCNSSFRGKAKTDPDAIPNVKLKQGTSTLTPDQPEYYLQSAPSYQILPPPLTTEIKRVPFAAHYGGSSYHFLQYLKNPSGHVKRRLVFPLPEMNPAVPSAPGEPGLIYASRHEILQNPPWSLFIKREPAIAIWTYVGDYEGELCGVMNAKMFMAQSEMVKKRWAVLLLTQKLDVYLSMRVRIALRRAGAIPLEDKDQEKEVIEQEKLAVKAGRPFYPVTEDDIISAFLKGDEVIDIIRMTCVSYDHVFAADIRNQLGDPDPVPTRKQTSKASKKVKLSTKTELKKPQKPRFASSSADVESDFEGDSDGVEGDSGDDFAGPMMDEIANPIPKPELRSQTRKALVQNFEMGDVLTTDEDDSSSDIYI